MANVFIDGQEGTTGLQIRDRLANRADIRLLEIAPEKRKDCDERRTLINEADIVITCLPDNAARESVALCQNPDTRFIDASTAHRTAPGWVYGFPELDDEQRKRIRQASRVTNPGCHAVGFIAALRPLIRSGLVPADYALVAHSLTGYSGGGRKMIEMYQGSTGDARERLACPRPYGLTLTHKHLPEMKALCGLTHFPLFQPVVGAYYQGMIVTIPLVTRMLAKQAGPEAIHEQLQGHYNGERFVRVMPLHDTASLDDGAQLNPLGCNHTNRLELFVFGHADQVLLAARLDNLGKGASGAAVQTLNLMLGADEALGLDP